MKRAGKCKTFGYMKPGGSKEGLVVKEKLISVITDDNKRKKLQFVCVNLFFAGVSAFMTVLNIITNKGALTAATALFTVFCLINYFLVKKGGKAGTKLVSVIFMAEIVMLDTFFIVSGNPDGFSVIWVAMLPYCSMLLFGRKQAVILSTFMLGLMVFFFWTPAGKALLQFDYNKTFMMRFPILYTAFFLLSVLMETIRVITQRELERLRETYRELSNHDHLTHMLNRAGLEELRSNADVKADQTVFIIDIDYFKKVNDTYGHEAGDLVLKKVSEEIGKTTGTEVCRWGGEEFVVWFPDSRQMCDPEDIRRNVEQLQIRLPKENNTIKVTVSIGVAAGMRDFDALVQSADKALYCAKVSGRNRVVCGTGDGSTPKIIM